MSGTTIPEISGPIVAQSATGATSIASPIVGTSLILAGTVVIVCVANQNSAAPTSVTDPKGNTYSLIKFQQFGGTSQGVSVWSSKITTALGSNDTITANFSGTSTNGQGIAVLWSSYLDNTVDVSVSNSASPGTNSSNVMDLTMTLATDDCFVIGFWGKGNTATNPLPAAGGTRAPTTNYTTTMDGGAQGNAIGGWRTTFAAGSQTFRATASADTGQAWAGIAVAFKVKPGMTARPLADTTGAAWSASGPSKTAATTLLLANNSIAVQAGDDLFISAVADTTSSNPVAGVSVSGIGGLAMGTPTIEAQCQEGNLASTGTVCLVRVPVTTGGTISTNGITITFTSSATAKAGAAVLFRGVGTKTLSGFSDGGGSGSTCIGPSAPVVSGRGIAQVSAGDIWISARCWEGVPSGFSTLDASGTNLMDLGEMPGAANGTTGGSAASNQSATIVYCPSAQRTISSGQSQTDLTITPNAGGSYATYGVASGPANIVGSSAGTTTATGALQAQTQLSGSSAGTGAATGQPAIRQQLTGSTAGTGATTGAITIPALLSGSTAGTGTTTGSLKAPPVLSGSAAATGTTTGALTAQPKLSGSADGVGTTTGALTAQPKLSGSAAGVGALTGQPTTPTTTTADLSGTSAGTSTATGSLSVTMSLSGSTAGSGATSGALSASSQLSGSTAGTGTTTGALAAQPKLSGSTNGVGTTTGSLAASPRLSGSSAGVGATIGTLTATALLSGTSTGVGIATGSVSVPGLAVLSGTAAGSGTTTGTLLTTPALAGSAVGAGTTVGALSATAQLSGLSNGVSTTTGALTAQPKLSGSTTGLGTTVGALTATSNLSGSSNGVGATIGNLTVPGLAVITGTAAGNSTTTGALTATSNLSGSSAGISSTTGALTSQPKLSGSSAGVGNTTGSIKTQPALSGLSAGTGNTTGVVSTSTRISGLANGVGSATGALGLPIFLVGTATGIGRVTGILVALATAKPLRPLNTSGYIEVADDGEIETAAGNTGILVEPTTGTVR